ncbi:chondroitinase-B domain-containing protein [Goodfellowiella coeruleoviolacea]|uniref:F5/8 type C domain-containing protein n=1 Tax=Goodfellowiella coeruleoviolacea TaxID=334858 RepID=A0AAE3KIQ8_9PSEU|nr:chondroitinase-B domain-containing protein [Goodfellowiella coeruleoviolacea]MCP2169521.1 F5/8 type C domain-containing protein [Goodfellowiella coeruleoviolacea]
MRRSHRAVVVTALAFAVSGAYHPVASAVGAALPVVGVVASGDDGNVPANTVDGDFGTRWSAEGEGVWIRYDLGSSQVVGSVSVAWHKGDTRRDTFDVQVSEDGSSWVTVVSRRTSSGSSLGLQDYDFADRAGRYVRIVGYGNTSNDWTSITEARINGRDADGGTCTYPSDVVDLTNWYVGLPIGEEESPTNVEQPELARFSVDPWFRATGDCAAVQFRAAVNGVTTSGSKYPRSELREMTDSGASKASWSSTSGVHTMVIDQAITALPAGQSVVVAGQIHDASDDVSVFRLEGSKLYVTNGDTSRYRLVTDDYVLGTRFQAKFEVSGGQIRAYYNGVLQTTISKSFSGGYFKAGVYTQANCSNSSPCSAGNYGEVRIYDLTVTHDDGDQGPAPGPGRVVNVATSSQLRSAFSAAQAGDRIVLADGEYTIGTMTGKNGTASQPITVVAANRGRAVVTDGQLEVANSSHVTFEGLKWTNSDTVKITSSNNVRLTRNHFRLTEDSSLKWVLIGGANSHHNRIDHNLFEEKHQLGNFITIDGSDTQQSQHDLIDHNHFRDIGPRAENEMEAIRVGWSEISRSSGFTVIESNLFENCDGDPEIISVKSNDNTVRYNTFRTSQGTLSHRHGNRGTFHGNFFLGGGKAGTGGIRVYGQDHRIYNNYFEGLTGTGYDAALQLDGGDVDTSGALSAHWRVYRATVVNNTFVNNVSNIEIGANYKLAPVDSVLADNVVTGGSGKLFNEIKAPVNLGYAGNIAWPTGSATVGVSKPTGAIRTVDPLLVREGSVYRIGPRSPAIDAGTGGHPFLTDDMDGQARAGGTDVGADELSSAAVTRGPLSATDVGPAAA